MRFFVGKLIGTSKAALLFLSRVLYGFQPSSLGHQASRLPRSVAGSHTADADAGTAVVASIACAAVVKGGATDGVGVKA